jgi:predicted secreted protein
MSCEYTTNSFGSDHKAIKAIFNSTPTREECQSPSPQLAKQPPVKESDPIGLTNQPKPSPILAEQRTAPITEETSGATRCNMTKISKKHLQ